MTTRTEPRPFTGRHMLIIMVSFFGVVIAVNIVMAISAFTTWNGLVAKNGYVASIDYAADEAARTKADALGWTVDLAAEDGVLTLTVRDDEGQVVPLDAVTADARREIKRDDPQHTLLAYVGEGAWRAETPLPAGRWSVTAHLSGAGETLDWRRVISVADAR